MISLHNLKDVSDKSLNKSEFEGDDLHKAGDRSDSTIYIIDIIRCIACLMIFFYHCNTILPDGFKWLTFFGEDMGNDLFFMLSGFSLFPSIERSALSDFPRWYLKRLKRILPMLVFFYILSYITGFYSFSDRAQVFTVFIYPTLYWFVTGILVFYIILFGVMKIKMKLIRLPILLLLMLLWIIRIDRMEGYYLIGFIAMMTGCILRDFIEGVRARRDNFPGKLRALFVLVIFSLVYIISKYYKFTGHKSTSIYFIVGLSVLAVGVSALSLGYAANKELEGFFDGREALYGIIRYVGMLALPVYMVQSFNAGIIGYTIGRRIGFPLSFAVNFMLIWILAIAAERAQSFLTALLTHRPRA